MMPESDATRRGATGFGATGLASDSECEIGARVDVPLCDGRRSEPVGPNRRHPMPQPNLDPNATAVLASVDLRTGDVHSRTVRWRDWDRDTELVARGDWEGLVRHRRRVALRSPDDPAARADLGEAYLLAGRARRALAVLREAYRKAPEWPDLPPLILEALDALGQDENDFAWVTPPSVAHLDAETLDRCAESLRARGREVELWELYEPFLEADWTTFGAWDLLGELLTDARFRVCQAETGPEARISLRWQALS